MTFKATFVVCFTLVLPASASQTLCSLPEVRNACKQRLNDRSFDCSGTVLIPPFFSRAPFYVAAGNDVLCLYDIRTNKTTRFAEGDSVRLIGCTEPAGDRANTNPNCYEIAVLSHGKTPAATPIKIRDLTQNYPPNRFVAIEGTIRDVFEDDIDPHYSFIILEDNDEFAYLAYPGDKVQLPTLRAMCGAAVSVSGVTFGESNRHNGKAMLTISGTNAFYVISRPRDNRFDALPICDEDMNHPSSMRSMGLRKISGTVIATWHNDMALLLDTNGCPVKIEFSEPSLPSISEPVEAVGYPETDLFHISLVRASWRPMAALCTAASPITKTSIKDLFVSPYGHYRIPTAEHGKTLRLKGTAKSILLDEHGGTRIILADGDYAIPVDCSNLKHSLNMMQEGCLVEITGVCIKDSDIWRPSFMIPRVRGLFLVPRSDDDMRILRRPPWWTPARFVVTLAILLIVIVAILIWNATLRVLVARKSRALLREQTAKLEETLKIDERTRLAAELHDYLAQNLTVISYQVSAAETALAANSKDAADCLKAADRMLLSCRADLRRCLWDLKSDALNEPDFAKAIEQTCEPVSGDAHLHVRFAVKRNLLSDSTAHAILSICRELVSNAVRHGMADNVKIAGELKSGTIRFSVRDNGTGFEPEKRPGQADGHFGLDGVAERIRHLNGQMQIDSRPGQGTRIAVTLRPKESQA